MIRIMFFSQLVDEANRMAAECADRLYSKDSSSPLETSLDEAGKVMF
jgi:hypothetical protein